MRFYIQVVDGEPYDHPLIETNMQHLFGNEFDPENLPEGFAQFFMIPPPNFVDTYDVAEYHYEWNEEKTAVQQVWTTRPMTENEKETEIKRQTKETVDFACFHLEHTLPNFTEYTDRLKEIINNPIPIKEIEWPQRPAGSWRDQ